MNRRRALGALIAVSLILWRPQAGAATERTLIVVLDAVPYETIERLTSGPGALFPGFAPPRPLISTFPSSTSVALPGIFGDLGLERSPGYEARFFDWQRLERRGGGLVSYFRIRFPWRSFFDWNRKGPIRNALHAARPVKSGIAEIRRAMASFRASSKSEFTIYIAETDTVAHLMGPEALAPLLRVLDDELRGLEGTRVVLLSDHGLAGGEPLVNVLPAVDERLAARGWRRRGRYQSPDDVVLTPFGLVSSFEAYGAPERAPDLAVTLASADGVELCVAPLPEASPEPAGAVEGRWRIAESAATVDFERRRGAAGTEWRWQGAGESVLLAVLPPGRQGRWVSDEELLRFTATAPFPDPLHRLAGAFAAVDNSASVVCSVAPGHMFGARGTERSARWTKGPLHWTHGALRRRASLGFVMSNEVRALAGAGGAIRFDRALDHVLPSANERVTSE